MLSLQRVALPVAGGGQEEVDNVYLMLDNQLRPVEPDVNCQQSVQIFREHKQVSDDRAPAIGRLGKMPCAGAQSRAGLPTNPALRWHFRISVRLLDVTASTYRLDASFF